MTKALISVACLALAAAMVGADLLADVSKVTDSGNRLTPFSEAHVGYDLHNDFFYFNDKAVDQEFARKKYTDTKISLAGQQPDMTGRVVPAAANPFVVGQKATLGLGVSSDRWDAKEDANGNQYLALYHGDKSDFVVNKLRGHLLRRVANALQDYLPVLDAGTNPPEGEPDAAFVETVVDEVKQIVSTLVKDVDELIRDSMKKDDDSSSSATILVITKRNIIVANVGEGQVLAYDELGDISVLNHLGAENLSTLTSCVAIGARKSRNGACLPRVEVVPRSSLDEDGDESKIQFLVVESPFVAKGISNDEAVKLVVSQVNQNKHAASYEQELYSGSANRILQTVTSRLGLLQKMFRIDHLVAIVGLETDYSKIH